MADIEMNKDIKILLESYKLPSDVIKLIENYHVESIKAVTEGVKEEMNNQANNSSKDKDTKRDFHDDVRNIANESRIIK